MLEFSLQLLSDIDMWRPIWKIDLKQRQEQCYVHSDIHHMLHIHVHVCNNIIIIIYICDDKATEIKVPEWPTWDMIISGTVSTRNVNSNIIPFLPLSCKYI